MGRRGKQPGSLSRFTCVDCGQIQLVSGGNTGFRCSDCRPPPTDQQLAHAAVARAIRAGALKRPTEFACEDCGQPAAQYDHRDYSKPLLVAPVCRRCNVRRGPAAQAIEGGVEGCDPRGADSLVSHSSAICPAEPLNTTQQI